MESEFRTLLQNELVYRAGANPKYSLRAFAASLKVSPSALSAMLNGKRPITNKMIERLGLQLGLELEEILDYQERKDSSNKGKRSYDRLALDEFALISQWYYFAILELLHVKDFQSSTSWIAKVLGITIHEARYAVDRLKRLDLVEEREDGSLIDISGGSTTNISPGLTSAASKKLQKDTLKKAQDAIDLINLDLRDNTSMTVAINPADLPVVKEKIKDFRRELVSFLEREKEENAREVYQMNFAVYPLTNIEKNLEELS